MAGRIDFNKRTIEGLIPPAEGRAEYRDTRTPGLYVRVTSNGVRTFSFVGRPKGSARVVRTTIGVFPTVTPDQARTEARRIAGELAAGHDANEALRGKRAELTLEKAGEMYLESLALSGKKDTYRLLWESYIKDALGNRKLSEIDFDLLHRWHRSLPAKIVARHEAQRAARARVQAERRAEIEARQAIRRRGPRPLDRPAKPQARVVTGEPTANRCIEVVRAIYNWCAHARRKLFAGVNPAAGQDLFAEHERERFLQRHEMEKFFLALAALDNQTMRDFFLLALLTGARRSNVASMRWAAIDLHKRTWQLNGSETKNGKPQLIPLTDEACAILRARLAGRDATWVFPSVRSRTGHIVNPHKAWHRVMETAGLTDLRPHDLRRTLGSWLARTGASLVIIGKALNHLDPSSTTIYARLDLDPVRQSVDNATTAIWDAAGSRSKALLVPKRSPPGSEPAST